MNKNLSKILSISLLTVLLFSSIVYAKPSQADIQKAIDSATANMTDEQKAMLESKVYQVAYKVMDTAITKGLAAIDKVNAKLVDGTMQIPEETKTMIETELTSVQKLLTDEQAKLKDANSLDDLKIIQQDLVDGLTEDAKNVEQIFLDQAQVLVGQANTALSALETTCGADVSSEQAQLDSISKKIDSYEVVLASGDTMTKEELQAKLQEMDPKEIQSQMQSLAADIQSLQSECPTVQ